MLEQAARCGALLPTLRHEAKRAVHAMSRKPIRAVVMVSEHSGYCIGEAQVHSEMLLQGREGLRCSLRVHESMSVTTARFKSWNTFPRMHVQTNYHLPTEAGRQRKRQHAQIIFWWARHMDPVSTCLMSWYSIAKYGHYYPGGPAILRSARSLRWWFAVAALCFSFCANEPLPGPLP